VAQKREQARREILQVAREKLRGGGVEAITLGSVAVQLGMTKQALYHYFPSKEALLRGLVTTLLDDEIETLVAVVEAPGSARHPLGKMIRAFHDHYIQRLDEFRIIYCQSQLYTAGRTTIDQDTLRDEIHPRTRHLFDRLEERIAGLSAGKAKRRQARQLAFTAWTSVLGLLTMLSIADANNDPLVHDDKDLLKVLADVFDKADHR
jgi:AcrR family transcriptional regulator